MKKIIIVSGYFNPIHKGHLEYFINAKDQGDLLYVIVNSDHPCYKDHVQWRIQIDYKYLIINNYLIFSIFTHRPSAFLALPGLQ
jgi:cytidyltransferase-like protein